MTCSGATGAATGATVCGTGAAGRLFANLGDISSRPFKSNDPIGESPLGLFSILIQNVIELPSVEM
jgi:hypothetical protein